MLHERVKGMWIKLNAAEGRGGQCWCCAEGEGGGAYKETQAALMESSQSRLEGKATKEEEAGRRRRRPAHAMGRAAPTSGRGGKSGGLCTRAEGAGAPWRGSAKNEGRGLMQLEVSGQVYGSSYGGRKAGVCGVWGMAQPNAGAWGPGFCPAG